MRRALLTLPLLMLPSACLLGEPGDRIVYSPCHALATGGWRASVARISVTQQKAPLHRTFLFVEGEVTAPESDTVSLDRGRSSTSPAPSSRSSCGPTGPAPAAPLSSTSRVVSGH